MLRLQAVTRILYKGKAPSFEGAVQGVTWRHAMVEENGFEPLKPKQQIYSLPPLTTRELLRI